MFLYLTANTPRNAKFITESGQVLYKSETPFKVTGRSTVVTKVVPNDAVRTSDATPRETLKQEDGPGEGKDDEDTWIKEADGADMQDKYQYLGDIKWNLLSPSIFVFPRDEEITVKEFFTTGCGWQAKMWTGADGRQYKWKTSDFSSLLVLDDANETAVAKYHRRKILNKEGQPKLEIIEGSGGEHVLDQIVFTFIYVETMRRKREQGARAGAA